MQRQSGVDDAALSPGPRSTPPTASSVRRSLSRTLAVSSGIVTGIVKRLSSTATTLMSSSASSPGPEWREEGDWNASVEPSGRSARRQTDDPDRSGDVDRASHSGGAAYRTVARGGEGKTSGDVSSTLSPNCYRREAVIVSENMSCTVSKSPLLRPTPNKISQLLPQFRKETSCASKSHSESVASTQNYSILPPYVSPFSGRIGDMPAVRLSPRLSPRPLKTEDRARPVTVKISQPDPLKTPFHRGRPIGDPEQSRSNSYCRSSSVETVVEALRKRKHSGIDIQEFDADGGIETRILEDAQQPLKRRCSRDSLTRVESLFNDSETMESSETILSRGMKRPALHTDPDVNLQTDSPPLGAGAAFKKACQKSSPVQSPLRRYACGAKNLIDASYTSIQRFEKRLRSDDSSRQSSMLHDKSMLSSGSRMTSRQTSPASSRVSWNTSQVNRDDLGTSAVPSSGPSSRCASPSTALDKSQEPAFGSSQRLLVKDGNRKNRLTVLNPCSATETKSNSEEQANAVLFTADDLERDRLLLSNRANWMLSEVGLADATSDVTSQKASTDVVVASAIPSEVGVLTAPSIASNTSSVMTCVGLFGQNVTTSKAVDTLTNPSHVTGKDAVVESCVIKSSSTTVPLSDLQTSSSTRSSIAPNNSDKSSLTISSSVGILAPSDQPVSTTCANLPSNSSDLPKSTVVDFNAGASTKLGGGDGLSDDVLGTSSQVSQSSLGSFVSAVATVSNLTTSVPLASSSSDISTPMTFTFSKNFPSSSITSSAVGSIATQKTFSSDSAKDPLTAASVVFGTQNSLLSASKNDTLTSGASSTERTVSASTIANAKSEKVGLEFASKIADLTPGSMSTGASVASMPVGSSLLQTSGKFTFGNSGATQSTGIKFGSLATTQTWDADSFGSLNSRGSFGANSGVSDTPGGRLGSAAVKQSVASGGFAFGDSGSAAAAAPSAFSSGGFVFGSAAASQPVTSEKAQNASSSAVPFANSNIIGTSANRLGNSAPIQSTAGGGGGGFAFGSSTTTQSSCFGQLGTMQTTLANSSGFGFSGTTQSSGSNNIFGSSTVTQGSGGFSFEKPVTSQTANSGFVFGTSATIQANGSLPGNGVNTSTNNSGLSTSMNTKLPAISFSKSGNAKLHGSGLSSSSSSSSNTGTFVFGKTATSLANTNFGGLSSVNAVGGNVMPNNTFGSSQAGSVPFSNSFASANVNNLVNSTPFGSGFSAISPFGTNLGSSTTFGTNLSSSTAFGSNPSKGDQFSSVTSNIGPFDSKPFASNPNVAHSMGSVNQSAAVPAFGASGASAGKQFPQLFSGDGFTADQPAPVFNFTGSKTDSVAVSSSGNFVFGKTANPFPTFSQNTGGFAFNHSSGNNLPSSSNQGFNFQVAAQPAANSQPSSREFNFSSFGQPQSIGTNGIPGPVPFGASGAMTPSFSLGMRTPAARANRGRKKAGR